MNATAEGYIPCENTDVKCAKDSLLLPDSRRALYFLRLAAAVFFSSVEICRIISETFFQALWSGNFSNPLSICGRSATLPSSQSGLEAIKLVTRLSSFCFSAHKSHFLRYKIILLSLTIIFLVYYFYTVA